MKEKNPKGFKEVKGYHLVRFFNNPKAGLKGFIAIHKKRKNYPSLGATRFRHYRSEQEALKDAVNLARLMTYKSAIAGLPYGGAKGVIMAPRKCSSVEKNKILAAYAEELNKLGGDFITGSDIGLDLNDVKNLRKKTRFVIGVKANPEYYTAAGVIVATRTVFKKIFGVQSFRGRTFAIQGLGKTGLNILKLLAKEKDIKVFISDLDRKGVTQARKIFPKVKFVSAESIFSQHADVFMPCAVGGVLNKKNIARLKVKIILGSANNQLESPKAGVLLQKRGIFYAPDYLVNSGGLIAVAEELKSQNPSGSSIMKKIKSMSKNLEKIIAASKKTGLSPILIMDKLAEKVFNKWR